MPVLFDPQLFGPPDLFGQSPKKSGEIGQYLAGAECEADIQCSPSGWSAVVRGRLTVASSIAGMLQMLYC